MIELEVYTVSNRSLGKIRVSPSGVVKDIKDEIAKLSRKLNINRQSIKTAIKSKSLSDDISITSLKLNDGSKVYVKDLGPQISWRTVFLYEYFGPLFVYLLFTIRPTIIYGNTSETWNFSTTTKIAAACWSLHYSKRILETIFVHRFSHATMPYTNLFKNSGYYWGFAAYVAYHTNHPLFTPPSCVQMVFGLSLFLISEIGNLSIHLLLRNLRPIGTTVRKNPVPNGNPFTVLFNYVSCPNYTYEIAAWFGYSIMTSCLPALIFTGVGGLQMTIWALEKHRKYKQEFSNYPRQRKAIIPFIL